MADFGTIRRRQNHGVGQRGIPERTSGPGFGAWVWILQGVL